jgi:hypothetical protein
MLCTGADSAKNAYIVTALAEYDYLTHGSRYKAFASSVFRSYQAQAPNYTWSGLNSENAYMPFLVNSHLALMDIGYGDWPHTTSIAHTTTAAP